MHIGNMHNSMTQKCSMNIVGPENDDDVSLLLDNIPELETFFKIGRRIGHGTFSSVYLGEAKSSQFGKCKHYAVKHIIPTSHPSRVYTELKCLKLIGGKCNVIKASCCFRNLNHIVIVMPYVPHDNFINYIGRLSVKELGSYLFNLFWALNRVHSFNIIHRDVKPANFLYSRKYQSYSLIDFGLAQEIESSLVKNFSPQLMETPQLNFSRKVKRKLAVSSPENSCSKKPCLAISSINNQSSTPSSVFTPASNRLNCTMPARQSPRKHQRTISLKSPQKKSITYCRPHSATPFRALENDSPSKHTRLAEANGNFPCSQTKTAKEMLFRDNSVISENNFEGFKLDPKDLCGGIAASLTPVSHMGTGTNSSNFSSRRSSTLQEVKTKSGKCILRPSSCSCYGSARVCAVCLARKNERAPRAGTPGFRAPEVLLRHPLQTTAVDMWSAGVMLLCLLSGKYPFFRAVEDTLSLAEIATILGTKVMKRAAAKLEKLFTCSEDKPTLDLMKVCEKMCYSTNMGIRASSSCGDKSIYEEKCEKCKQKFECVCNDINSNNYCSQLPDANCVTPTAKQIYPPSVYNLLSRLLDPNPDTRITAEEALKHPFVLAHSQ